jgi:TolB-like protein/DNA-binding winged helix-turn-helix (wHTH) protein/tetratricopeptide (TPR) repeat protein
MVMSSSIFRFGPFEARTDAQQLSRNGIRIKLRGQPFSILELLLSHAGEVVTREEIRLTLWPADTFVDFEHGLNTSIKKLRQALGDSATEPRYVETLPRLGYRFIAAVETVAEPDKKRVNQETSEEVSGIPEVPGSSDSPANAIPPHPAVAGAFPAREHGRGVPRLQWLLGAAVLLAAGALVFNVSESRTRLFAFFRSTKNASVAVAASPKPPRSIVVLPLQNLSNNPAEDYFADGMTDELTTDLAQFGSLRVISRTSAMRYKGANKTAPEIGRELGVDTLIEGTVQRVANRVRIRIQLIDSASDRHLWARSYDHELKDVLVLQSSAARDIAEEVQGKVAPKTDLSAGNPHPVQPDAYEAYLKGRYFWNKRNEEGLKKSIDYFQQAISLDPKFAAAYAGLADSYSILGSDVLPAKVASAKAHDAANKAVELDPTIAEGHAELALVAFYYDWDWTRAEQEFRRAIELNPNYATAHHWYSYYLSAMRRFQEAMAEATRAQQIDPLSLSVNTTVAGRARDLGEYAQAIDLSRRTLEMDPNFVPAHIALGSIYEDQGMWAQAISEYQKAVELSHRSPPALASLGHAYGVAGQQKEARTILASLREASKTRYVSAFDMAVVFAGIGDNDAAFQWLEKAYAERESQMAFLNVTRRLDPVRSDPRFADLLHRMGLDAAHPSTSANLRQNYFAGFQSVTREGQEGSTGISNFP